MPVDFTEEVRSWIEEHHKLQQLLREISELSLMLVRSHAQERQRRRDYPQRRLCLSGDGLYACGRTLQLAKDYHCNYVLVFKEGRRRTIT